MLRLHGSWYVYKLFVGRKTTNRSPQAEKEEQDEANKGKKDQINAREAKMREAALGAPKGKGKGKK